MLPLPLPPPHFSLSSPLSLSLCLFWFRAQSEGDGSEKFWVLLADYTNRQNSKEGWRSLGAMSVTLVWGFTQNRGAPRFLPESGSQ